jgi:Tfp pilus assembly protein PilO
MERLVMNQGQLVKEIEHFRRVLQLAYEGDSWCRLKTMDQTCENLLDTLDKCQVPSEHLNHLAAELSRMKVKFKPFLARCPVHAEMHSLHLMPSEKVVLH